MPKSTFFPVFILLFCTLSLYSCSEQSRSPVPDMQDQPRLLVFTKTEGYRHASIPKGVEALEKIASENGWSIHHTEDASVFNPDTLNTYRTVIFLSTTGDIFNETQQNAFEDFIQNGGGFVGIHAATDTEYDWPWYGDMVGAYFESHPQIQEARLKVVDRSHPSTDFLPEEWIRTDEWYNFMDINPGINVLINLDENSYEGGNNGDNHPIAWFHKFEGGHIFYTGGGHTSESFDSEPFLNHLKGGIEYVLQNSLE
ncbi:ThuA domain-containing protein [Balneolaceae bacterium YR4-1]|uniref:ThuA domain-containing protein n=2 Tax=Halalkalibaculum roseum TaxID=2709311 RepID=A0A6M1T150_9BACT|nr:ThuA domain-containing protein [Halalkalibaculum roseum]